MKNNILKFLALSLLLVSQVQAITVDEIMAGYYENTGGKQAWSELKGIKMTGEMNQGGMKFPLEIVALKDGRQYVKFTFQGKEIKQGVFDGKVMWNTNFMSMKAEKADAETTANQKLDINDFPFPLFNYKEKGYALELLGTEEKDGAETYKLKLIREPKTYDGKEAEDVSFYYLEVDSLVPLVTESEIKSGPMKGKTAESKLGDYQEVDGLYFPFSLTQGIKDVGGAAMILSKVELNPSIDDSEFAMPKEEVKEEPKEEPKEAVTEKAK